MICDTVEGWAVTWVTVDSTIAVNWVLRDHIKLLNAQKGAKIYLRWLMIMLCWATILKTKCEDCSLSNYVLEWMDIKSSKIEPSEISNILKWQSFFKKCKKGKINTKRCFKIKLCFFNCCFKIVRVNKKHKYQLRVTQSKSIFGRWKWAINIELES